MGVWTPFPSASAQRTSSWPAWREAPHQRSSVVPGIQPLECFSLCQARVATPPWQHPPSGIAGNPLHLHSTFHWLRTAGPPVPPICQ